MSAYPQGMGWRERMMRWLDDHESTAEKAMGVVEFVIDKALLATFAFWILSWAISWLLTAARAWSLLYAGQGDRAFWTIVRASLPSLVLMGFFYSLYRLYEWARPRLERWRPEVEWPDIAFRFPWQPRPADEDDA